MLIVSVTNLAGRPLANVPVVDIRHAENDGWSLAVIVFQPALALKQSSGPPSSLTSN